MSMLRTNEQNLAKIVQILQKPEEQREAQQVHFLSLALKKKILDTREIDDWWLLHRCIQSLIVVSGQYIKPAKIQWIFVIAGHFSYHGMVYVQGEHMTVQKEQSEHLILSKECVYLILTRHALKAAKNSSEDRKIFEQKEFVRKVLFGRITISNRLFHQFWMNMLNVKVSRGQQLDLKPFEDYFFIIISGSLSMEYGWRRTIKLRELKEGSLFSTYLGRYFNTTGEKLKNQQKLQFTYVGNQDTLLLAFPIDLFYEDLRFQQLKFVVERCWKIYLERVTEINRIIKELGIMKPEKQQVKKSLREQLQLKQLHERAISVPVAIQKRKFRKIIYNFFDERSNRRKVPNLAIKSDKNILNKTAKTLSIRQQAKTERSEQKTFTMRNENRKNHQRSYTQAISSGEKDKLKISFSLEHLKTRQATIQHNVEQPQQDSKYMSINNFFRPDQFVSHKLKIHYQTILSKLQKLKVPTGKTEHSAQRQKFKSDKEYFEQYVNERRIVKLGPKKRLLYKKRQGF